MGKEFACPFCTERHKIPVKKIEIGNIKKISGFVSSLLENKKKILILSDNITYEVAGKKCERILKEKFYVESFILSPEEEKTVSAKEEYLPRILEKTHGKNCILTVGTGTITDLGKYAANELNIPVISFPTAPSMNGYTSGVSAIISEGLKVTASVQPVTGIFVDTDIVSESPIDLIKAGFADSLAKAFANTDWKISSIITGEYFCPLPMKIVSQAEKEYIHEGDKLLQRDSTVITSLMEGLNLGGIAMLIAGKSSPASGGEHLISHFLDMYVHQKKQEIFAYHGLQVGIGILISSLIYDYLKTLSSDQVNELISSTIIDYESEINTLESDIFNGISLKKEFKKKRTIIKKLRKELPDKWEKIKKTIFSFTHSYSDMRKYLSDAQCPLTFREIGVNDDLGYNAIMFSRYIRGRLTILDIAGELGILKEITKNFYRKDL